MSHVKVLPLSPGQGEKNQAQLKDLSPVFLGMSAGCLVGRQTWHCLSLFSLLAPVWLGKTHAPTEWVSSSVKCSAGDPTRLWVKGRSRVHSTLRSRVPLGQTPRVSLFLPSKLGANASRDCFRLNRSCRLESTVQSLGRCCRQTETIIFGSGSSKPPPTIPEARRQCGARALSGR